jgi:hypothetical protein
MWVPFKKLCDLTPQNIDKIKKLLEVDEIINFKDLAPDTYVPLAGVPEIYTLPDNAKRVNIPIKFSIYGIIKELKVISYLCDDTLYILFKDN